MTNWNPLKAIENFMEAIAQGIGKMKNVHTEKVFCWYLISIKIKNFLKAAWKFFLIIQSTQSFASVKLR